MVVPKFCRCTSYQLIVVALRKRNWIMTFFTMVAIAPMRAEASHRSEMVSQLLFGELCEWLDETGDFVKVKCRYDGYEGWVQRSQLAAIETGSHDVTVVTSGNENEGVWVDGFSVALSPGSEFYFKAVKKGSVDYSQLLLEGHDIRYPQWQALPPLEGVIESDKTAIVLSLANHFLGTPYLWGGKSRWGIDCSGFVQMVFKMAEMFMPRDAWQQAEGGDVVGFLQEAKQGDLAFFDNAEGRITHVGILRNDHEIIHASGVVRIDPIDNYGIVNKQSGKRTHNLRIIKRFF